MRTIAISIFILLWMFASAVVNSLSADLRTIDPLNNGLIISTPMKTPTADSVGLNGTIDGLDSLNLLDRPANELETQGGEYGSLSMTKVITSVLINSTVGFGDYVRGLLGVGHTGTVSAVIEMVQWLVVLNHAFAILQLLYKPLGGGL